MELAALLTDQIERLLADQVDRPCLQAAEAGTWPARLWAALDEFGLTTALVPERLGGSGLTWADAGVILRATGRFAAPVPLGETMIAARLLAEAGIDIPPGVLSFADGRHLTLRDGALDGEIEAVAWGARASHLVIATGAPGDGRLCLIESRQADIRAQRGIGRDERAGLVLRGVRPLAVAELGDACDRLLALGALMRASQIAGALGRCLDLAVEHANTRSQFGRPIGRFQAIQQALAELAAEVAAAEVAAAAGWRAFEAGDVMFAPAVARIRCSEAARLGAAIAHQVHGAIGVTDEHMLHYFTRRLWQWRLEFGAETWWAERLGAQVLGAGGNALWPLLTQD
jgi:acyl-CoA dehydrogenase